MYEIRFKWRYESLLVNKNSLLCLIFESLLGISTVPNLNELCYKALNRQLDELDQVLDSLEHKNDVIHSQLRELLADSKQVTFFLNF